MSESTAPAPKRSRRGAQPQQEREDEAGEFERRRTQLAFVLSGLDRELWKRGLTAGSGPDSATSASSGRGDEEERKRVKEVTGTMFRELESRLGTFAGACARLAEDERASLAALLRLPEPKRRVIVAILRLPERERGVLRIAFGLSEPECHALAELLRPTATPAAERPSITIVDPSVLEGEGQAPSVA